ncbi:MAG: dockerin type I domain-containing protein [Ruminococcus sp.]|nr:dockerin type I domain-containing protein [Ruminococcus sp.]
MKKFISILTATAMILSMSAVSISASSMNRNSNNVSGFFGSQNSVRIRQVECTSYYDENDNLVQKVYSLVRNADTNPIKTEISVLEFDSSGNISKEIEFEDDGETEIEHFAYEYDAAGKLIRKIALENDREVDITTYEYDSAGNLVKETSVDEEYETETTVYQYSAGNLVKKVVADGEGETETTTYEYSAGLLVKETAIDSDERTPEVDTYEYDAAGNLVKKVDDSGDGDVEIYEYVYDANGNLVSVTETENGRSVKTEYSYVDSHAKAPTYGDLNGDDLISISDFIALTKYVLGQLKLVSQTVASADVSNDGVVNAVDIGVIKYLLLNAERNPQTPATN